MAKDSAKETGMPAVASPCKVLKMQEHGQVSETVNSKCMSCLHTSQACGLVCGGFVWNLGNLAFYSTCLAKHHLKSQERVLLGWQPR